MASLSNKESCDGEPLAGLAKRFPAVKASTNTDKQNKLCHMRRSQVKLCDLSLKYPELAAEVWGVAEGMLIKHISDKEAAEDRFSEQYKQLWRIPGGWKSSWIEKLSKNKITQQMIADHIKKDKANASFEHEAFYFLTKTHAYTKVPDECQSKVVCQRTMNYRHDEWCLQRRIHVVYNILQGDASWHTHGPYKVTFCPISDIALTIQYDDGTVVCVPSDDTFSKKWKLFDAFADDVAHVKHPTTKRVAKLASYFSDGDGPKWAGTELKDMAELVFGELQDEVEKLAQSLATDTCSVVTQVHKEIKRSAAQDRAKAMVAANKRRRSESGKAFDHADDEPSEELDDSGLKRIVPLHHVPAEWPPAEEEEVPFALAASVPSSLVE